MATDNTGDPATLVLEGTVYVTRNLEFKQAGQKEYTVNLNGHTIFVEGGIDFPSYRVKVCGSGCIIAVGDINFQPSVDSEVHEFVLILSITGETTFQPKGEYTGCVAGDKTVKIQSGSTIDWISPDGKGLDFPMGGLGEELQINGISIESWQIK